MKDRQPILHQILTEYYKKCTFLPKNESANK